MAPGWTKEWHVGVRATASRKLVAFISAVPVELRVRNKRLKASEVNFLCVHKKLRSKRLTPVLIKEVTRRCHLQGVFQAIYTAGIVLPTPISTCRYFHRSLEWQKLYEVGFSPLPANSKPAYQVRKYALPEQTQIKGLRPMELRDADAVLDLLGRYLLKFEIAPVFTKEEIIHWMLHKKGTEQVIWAYVVEVSTHRPRKSTAANHPRTPPQKWSPISSPSTTSNQPSSNLGNMTPFAPPTSFTTPQPLLWSRLPPWQLSPPQLPLPNLPP